jgi:flagellar P-ring protein precursor FlgI
LSSFIIIFLPLSSVTTEILNILIAFSNGTTQAVQNAQVNVNEPNKPMFLFKPGVELRDIVEAVNQIGATPSALIAILEALKSAGSLRAELVII